MMKREYELIVTTMYALSPNWIDVDMMNKVADKVCKTREDFHHGKFLSAVEKSRATERPTK